MVAHEPSGPLVDQIVAGEHGVDDGVQTALRHVLLPPPKSMSSPSSRGTTAPC